MLDNELIELNVKIDAEQGELAAKLKESQTSIVTYRKEVAELEKALSYLKATGSKNTDQINSLTKELKEKKSALKDAREMSKNLAQTLNINTMSADQLKKKAKELRGAMNSLSKDLQPQEWNRLNDELKKVETRFNEVQVGGKKVSETFNISFSGISKKVGKISLIASAVTSVASVLKKFGQETQVWGDRIQATTTGISNAYSEMIRRISTGDWSGLFRNMAEAYSQGRKFQEMLDEVFELQNAQNIQEVLFQNEIAELQLVMDDVNRSDQERLAAADKIREIYEKIGTIRKDTAKQEMDAYAQRLQDKTKMEDEEREFMLDNYHQNRETILAATELLNLQEKLGNMKSKQQRAMLYSGSLPFEYGVDLPRQISETEAAINVIQDKFKDTPEALEYAATVIKKYNLTNDEVISAFVNSYTKWLGVEGDVMRESRRANRQRNTLLKEMGEEAVRKQEELQKKSSEEREALYNQDLQAAETAHNKEITELKRAYAQEEIDQAEYAARSEAAEIALLNKKIELNTLYGKDVNALYQQLYDRQIAQMESVGTEVESLLDSSGMDPEIQAQIDEFKRLKGKSEKMFRTPESDLDTEIKDLQAMLDMKLITEEQYLQKRNELVEQYSATQRKSETKVWSETFGMVSDYVNQVAGVISSLQEAQMAAIDARMEKELAAAGDNAQERERIEREYEEERLNLQKKYANVNMGIQIAQAIANSAIAIGRQYADLPLAAAIPASAVVAAATAAQIAVAVSQRNAIMNQSAGSASSSSGSSSRASNAGYAEGGYTGDGRRLEPAGVVHRGEYVVPQPELRSPTVRRYVEEIENMRIRRTGGHSSLPGYADGGFVGQTSEMELSVLQEIAELLRYLKMNPIKAYTVLSEQQALSDLLNRFKQVTSKS